MFNKFCVRLYFILYYLINTLQTPLPPLSESQFQNLLINATTETDQQMTSQHCYLLFHKSASLRLQRAAANQPLCASQLIAQHVTALLWTLTGTLGVTKSRGGTYQFVACIRRKRIVLSGRLAYRTLAAGLQDTTEHYRSVPTLQNTTERYLHYRTLPTLQNATEQYLQYRTLQNATYTTEHYLRYRTLPTLQNTTEHYLLYRTLPTLQNTTYNTEHYKTLPTLQNTTEHYLLYRTLPTLQNTTYTTKHYLHYRTLQNTTYPTEHFKKLTKLQKTTTEHYLQYRTLQNTTEHYL
jgi:hypothetical protein